MAAEHYTPKSNRGWQRKKWPVTLKTVCMGSLVSQICQMNLAQNPDKSRAMRKLLQENVPVEVLREFLTYSRTCLLSPKNLICLLEVLPKETFASTVDLLGCYRGTECCKPENSMNWLYGFIPEIAVKKDALTQLYKALDQADLTKLRTLSLWAVPDSFKPASIPNIIARAKFLTKIVLRGGTDDHMLRVIALNCKSLKYLDVARSPKITRKGLRNLFLAKPRSDAQLPTPLPKSYKTALAGSLNTLIISIFGLQPTELFTAASYMNSGYTVTMLPEYCLSSAVAFPLHKGLEWRAAMNLSPYEKFNNCFGYDDWVKVENGMRATLRPFEYLYVDVYRNSEDKILLYVREKSFLLKALFTISIGHGITELSLYWDRFNWDMDHLVVLADLVIAVPNVEKLQCRMRGGYDWPGLIFPKLKTLNAWCLEDSSAIAFLQHCPSLEVMDMKNVRAVHIVQKRLTHQILLEALEMNPGIRSTIRDLVIRPTDLTVESVFALHQACPKLERIGDLECWNVNEDQIRRLNKYMDQKNSQCSLVVLSFPPNLNSTEH